MVSGNLHVKGSSTIAQVFSGQDGTLLTDQESGLLYTISNFDHNDHLNMNRLTEKVLHPTLSGHTERSETFKFLTP